MPARDLEGHQAHLPRPTRRFEGTVHPPYLENVDLRGPELDRPAHRNAVHEPSVQEVLTVDDDRSEQPRHGRGGEHGVDDRPTREPVLRGPLDAGRHALERNRECFDLAHRQRLLERPPQTRGLV